MTGTAGILVFIAASVFAYGFYFYRRAQIAKAGGLDAHSRAHLNRLFELSADEQVTAAWTAVTVPKLSKGEKVAEIAGVAAAVLVGVGVQFVGRSLAIALTSENRLLWLDTKDGRVQRFGPGERPRFSATDKKGSKQPSQTRMGWDDGAIVTFEGFGDEPVEIDIVGSAVPVLVGWSRGDDVSGLAGPFPQQGTI